MEVFLHLETGGARDAERQVLAEDLSGIKVQVAEARTAAAGVGRDDGVDDSDIEDGPPLAATTPAEFELCYQTFLALREPERKVSLCSAPRFVPQHGHSLPWHRIGLLVRCVRGTALRSCAKCGARRLNRWSLLALRPAKFSIPSTPRLAGRFTHNCLCTCRHARCVEASVCVRVWVC